MPHPRLLAVLAAAAALLAAPAAVPSAAAAPPMAAPVTAQAAPGGASRVPGHDRLGVRAAGGTWAVRDGLGGGTVRSWSDGSPGWHPVAGDTDGDGTGTLSLFRDGVWLVRDVEQGGPGSAARTVRFGLPGDLPVVGDWDGDGVDTLGVFRRGRWFLRSSNAGAPAAYRTVGYGVPGDVPVVGDWDADGSDDIAVRRGSRWFQRDDASSGPSSRTFLSGLPGDLPVAGDWDHDGRDTIGLFRAGTWFLRQGNGFGTYLTTRFGGAGDRPVVRRTPSLAPGVTHQVVRGAGPTVAHVATVDLAAASSPDAVLSGDDLAGLEATTSMARRTGAVLAVNGDYFQSSGRPVHVMAADGRLLQTAQLFGRAVGLDLPGTRVQMGFPDARAEVSTTDATGTVTTTPVGRWNSGLSGGASIAAFTGIGAGLSVPPAEVCYASGTTSGPRTVRPDGGVETLLQVSGTRCGGPPPYVGPTTTVLAAEPGTPGGDVVARLPAGPLPLTTHLGFPGAVDVLGGNPLLLQGGVRQEADLVGAGAFFARQPRTAVGATADGRLLLVVVDGRQPGYSVGMTLGELADLLRQLGAVDAINLDGGGSSTMVVDGLLANRPSDCRERPVANALVVLPGADEGQADLQPGAPFGTAPLRTRSLSPRAEAEVPEAVEAPAAARPGGAAAAWREAAGDPGSVGGLADALERDGVVLPRDLARADEVFDAAAGAAGQ